MELRRKECQDFKSSVPGSCGIFAGRNPTPHPWNVVQLQKAHPEIVGRQLLTLLHWGVEFAAAGRQQHTDI